MVYADVLSGLAVAAIAYVVGIITSRISTMMDATWNPVALPSMLCAVWSTGWASGEGAVFGLLGWWCACLASIDVGSRRLPNPLTGAGAVAVLGYGVAVGHAGIVCTGAAGLFCVYLLVHLALPDAFGAGDVKLAVPLGGITAVVGLESWMLAAVLAPLLTGLLGAAALIVGQRHSRLPHGPSMCLSTLLAVVSAPS